MSVRNYGSLSKRFEHDPTFRAAEEKVRAAEREINLASPGVSDLERLVGSLETQAAKGGEVSQRLLFERANLKQAKAALQEIRERLEAATAERNALIGPK